MARDVLGLHITCIRASLLVTFGGLGALITVLAPSFSVRGRPVVSGHHLNISVSSSRRTHRIDPVLSSVTCTSMRNSR